MEKTKFEEILGKLDIPYEEWIILRDIDSIVLKDGRGVYPDWTHMRFLFTKKGEVLIRHGYSKPYGGRLSPRFAPAYDGGTISFPPGSPVYPSEFYNIEDVPELKTGCIIRAIESDGKIIGEAIVTIVSSGFSSTVVSLSNRININKNALLCFYDPMHKNVDAVHGTISSGIFLNFFENAGKKSGKYGTVHEVIKMKDIKEVNLKLATRFKTYKID